MPSDSTAGSVLSPLRRKLLKIEVSEGYMNAAAGLRRDLPRKPTYWDRAKGITSVGQYALVSTPEIFDPEPFGSAPPLRILEIGPGVGIWMEYARAAGHEVEGVDAIPMYVQVSLYEEMTQEMGLNVHYVGFDAVMEELKTEDGMEKWGWRYNLIHLRGSLDAVIGRFPEDIQRERVQEFGRACDAMLLPGGVVHISHNTDKLLPLILEELKADAGLRFEQIDRQTTRHWRD